MSKPIKLGISIGDTNGVGLEVILKSFHEKRMLDFCTPILFGDYQLAMNTKKQLGLEEINLHKIQSLKESKHKKVNTSGPQSGFQLLIFNKILQECLVLNSN